MFKSFLLTVLLIKHCDAQCSSTCPPIDDSGNPVESLCVGDTFTSSVSSSYDTCYPANAPAEIDFNSLKSSYDVIVVSNYYVGCNAGRRESGVYGESVIAILPIAYCMYTYTLHSLFTICILTCSTRWNSIHIAENARCKQSNWFCECCTWWRFLHKLVRHLFGFCGGYIQFLSGDILDYATYSRRQ